MTQPRTYKYYDFCMAAFVCILLCANLIGPAKATTITLPVIGPVTFLAGVLFFPISYFFGDILTEVYGYGRDRRVVWAGFAALLFASVMAAMVETPPARLTARVLKAASASNQVARASPMPATNARTGALAITCVSTMTMSGLNGQQSQPMQLPSASYHAGMRWPHHSWREMHQSWMLVSHWL